MDTQEALIVVDYQNTFVPKEEGWTWELWVEWAWKLAPYINNLVNQFRSAWRIIITSKDMHQVGHISLASSYIWKTAITEAYAQWVNPNPISHPDYFLRPKEIQNWDSVSNSLRDWSNYNYEELKAYLAEIWSQALWPDHAMSWERSSELFGEYIGAETDIELIKWDTLERDSYSAFWWKIHSNNSSLELEEFLETQRIKTVHIVWVASDYCVWWTWDDSIDKWFETIIHTSWIAWVNKEGSEEYLKKLQEKWVILIDL
jgi:nicotinamidase-related amidase